MSQDKAHMSQDNQDKYLTISVSDLVTLKKYFHKINEENLQLQHEILTVREGLNKISGAIIDVEKYIAGVEAELTHMHNRMDKVIKYFEKKESIAHIDKTDAGISTHSTQPSHPHSVPQEKPVQPLSTVPTLSNIPNVPTIPTIPNVPTVLTVPNVPTAHTIPHIPHVPLVKPVPHIKPVPPLIETQSAETNESVFIPKQELKPEHFAALDTIVELNHPEVVPDDEKTRKKDSDSVMIFISPEIDSPKGNGDDSTRESRRQLMPTMEEEKILLGYLQCNGSTITQGEYERLLKEISSMLINSPKNAIAIEIRKVESIAEHHTLELCYHIKVKDELHKASFNYFDYIGKEKRI